MLNSALREFTLVHVMMQHVARWPPTFGPSRSAWTISPPVGCQLTTPTIAILLLLSPKADTHVTIPRRVEGWVDLGGWLHTEMVYPLAHGHSSHSSINRAHRRVTSLIETNALMPRHHNHQPRHRHSLCNVTVRIVPAFHWALIDSIIQRLICLGVFWCSRKAIWKNMRCIQLAVLCNSEPTTSFCSPRTSRNIIGLFSSLTNHTVTPHPVLLYILSHYGVNDTIPTVPLSPVSRLLQSATQFTLRYDTII